MLRAGRCCSTSGNSNAGAGEAGGQLYVDVVGADGGAEIGNVLQQLPVRRQLVERRCPADPVEIGNAGARRQPRGVFGCGIDAPVAADAVENQQLAIAGCGNAQRQVGFATAEVEVSTPARISMRIAGYWRRISAASGATSYATSGGAAMRTRPCGRCASPSIATAAALAHSAMRCAAGNNEPGGGQAHALALAHEQRLAHALLQFAGCAGSALAGPAAAGARRR